jgi:uncharacterized membrane protein|eukprot:gene7453-7517_t
METKKNSPSSVAIKWAVIYVVTSIVITYAFQFLNISQNSSLKYLSYIPFIAFLLLAQKEYKEQLGGFISFGDGFMSGFLYSVFGGLMVAVFIYVYLGILSPQVLDQTMAEQQTKMAEQGLSSEQSEKALEMVKKYGAILGAVGTAIVIPIFGAIVALIGAAIFKKEKSAFDLQQDITTYSDPTA